MSSSTLPPPAPRRPIHTRRISFEGFLRDDGLWDIDCRLVDTKAYVTRLRERGELAPGEPIHDLQVRLTLDDSFTIRDVQAGVGAVPFGECHKAAHEPLRKLIGLTIGPGWRKAIDSVIGGVAGCTHLRELVFNAATAAFQMIPYHRAAERGLDESRLDKPPFYMGKCMTWAFDGPVMQRLAPQFYRGRQPADTGA